MQARDLRTAGERGKQAWSPDEHSSSVSALHSSWAAWPDWLPLYCRRKGEPEEECDPTWTLYNDAIRTGKQITREEYFHD